MTTTLGRLAALAAFVCLIVLRAPTLLVRPRFWAEEGTLYFVHARTHGLWEALLAPHLGYFSLFDNLAAAVAARAPLEYAPLVTTLFALAIQVVVLIQLLWMPSTQERPITLTTRCLGCAAVILATPTAEIWLNTINSQFFLCVATFLVLVARPRRWSPASTGLLLLSGFSGVVSCYLLPLFIRKALRLRTIAAKVEAVTLTLVTLVQFSVVIACRLADGAGAAHRLRVPSADTLLAILFSKSVVLPAAGARASDRFAELFHTVSASQGAWLHLGLVLLVAGALLGLGLLVFARLTDPIEHAGAYLLLAIGCVSTSLAGDKILFVLGDFGGRYFYAPNAIVLLGLAETVGSALEAGMANLSRWNGARTALLGFLFIGSLSRFQLSPFFGSGPDWRTELRRWRAAPGYRVHVWPDEEYWRLSL